MQVLAALVFCLFLQTASPTVKSENPVIKNKATNQKKGGLQQSKKDEAHNLTSQGAQESRVQSNAKDQHQQTDSHAWFYPVHEVSPPEPRDTPLFLPYLIATMLGVVVNSIILTLIWIQTKINAKQVKVSLVAIKVSARSARAARASADAATQTVGSLAQQLEEMRKSREQTDKLIKAASDQVAEMQNAGNQTEQMIAQSKEQVAALATLASTTAISARAAKDSADALVASERAWVMLKVDFNRLLGQALDGDISTCVYVDIVFRNFGKTPALIDEVCCNLGLFDWFPETQDFASMEPYDSVPEEIRAGKRSKPRLYQPQCIGQKTSDNVMMIYGIVKYRDIFGHKRSTTFGYSVIGIGESAKLKRLVEPAYNQYT